jgi:hypothetical protein
VRLYHVGRVFRTQRLLEVEHVPARPGERHQLQEKGRDTILQRPAVSLIAIRIYVVRKDEIQFQEPRLTGGLQRTSLLRLMP